jgi:hypothetical protein
MPHRGHYQIWQALERLSRLDFQHNTEVIAI